MSRLTLFLAALLLGACSSVPKHHTFAAIHHDAPSSAAVTRHITSLDNIVASSGGHVDRAAALVAKIAADAPAVAIETTALQLEMKSLRENLDHMAVESRGAQSEVATLQEKIETQNLQFNAKEREDAALKGQVADLAAENSSLRRSLTWERLKGKLGFFGILGAGLAVIVLCFVFKVVKLGARLAPVAAAL